MELEEVVESRVCIKCGETKPITEYHKHGKGHRTDCKICNRAHSKARYEAKKEEYRIYNKAYGIAHKEEISANKKEYYEANKEELSVKHKENYYANQEHYLAQKKVYREENKEWISEKGKQHYVDNLEVLLAISAEWRRKNPEQHAANHKRWRLANPERCKYLSHKRRATVLASIGSFVPGDIRELFDKQQGTCVYCDIPLDDTYHVDHIFPISRYMFNNKENLQILCSHCNQSKNAKEPDVYEQKIGFLTPERSLFLSSLKSLISSEWELKNLQDNELSEFNTQEL